MSEHDYHHHDQPAAEPAVTDAGSRALEDALRSSFVIVKAVMLILLVVFIFSGMKTVEPQQRAIILRFGKPVGTGELLGPGLHWAWPYPIDEVVTVPFTEIQKVTSSIGWFSLTPAQEAAGEKPRPMPSLNPAVEGYLVMADNDIMHARATLGYRITDPITYTLGFHNASNAVQNVLNNALIYAAARATADESLTNNTVFKEKVLARVREQIEAQKLGITIEPGSEVKVVPPPYLQPDFDAVTAAGQDLSRVVETARGNADTTVRNAETEANLLVNTAESQRDSTVKGLQYFAISFTNQLPQYQANPELFRQRVLTETWKRVLARSDEKFIQPVVPGQTEYRLQIGRELTKPKTATPAQP